MGDSRIYLLRDGEFTQLTADQDYMSILLDRVIDGKIDWQQAKNDPERNALAQFVGSGVQLYPDMNCIPLRTQPGDRLLICSDGVYNALSGEELRQSLTLTAGGAAEDILGRVLARGYANQDNFTAVVLQFMPGWSDSQQPDVGIPEEGCHIDSAFRAVGCDPLRAAQYIHNGVFTCGGDNVSAYYFRRGVLLAPGGWARGNTARGRIPAVHGGIPEMCERGRDDGGPDKIAKRHRVASGNAEAAYPGFRGRRGILRRVRYREIRTRRAAARKIPPADSSGIADSGSGGCSRNCGSVDLADFRSAVLSGLHI